MGLSIETPGPPALSGDSGASITAHGAVTGPASGATICSVPSTSTIAGVSYQVDVYAYIDGTAAQATDDDNMTVSVVGGTTFTIPVNGTAGGILPPYKFTYFTPPVSGTAAINVKAVAAATSTAVYHATIVATPVSD